MNPINNNEEYPKSFVVPFIPENSVEDSVMVCYAIVNTSVTRPEIMIMNRYPSSPIKGQMFSWDTFALTVTDAYPSSYEEFYQTYEKHKNGISAVAALDKGDKQRISITLMPEDAAAKADIPLIPIATVYDRETEAGLYWFFRDLEDRYLEIKNGKKGSDS